MIDTEKLISAYQRVFNSSEGMDVLNDLREFSGIDAPFGCAVTHEEFAYKAGMQDMMKYIEALTSAKE
jgi:hypothetical protein